MFLQTVYFAQWTEMLSHMLKMEMAQNSVFEHTSRLVLLDGQLWLAVSLSGTFLHFELRRFSIINKDFRTFV